MVAGAALRPMRKKSEANGCLALCFSTHSSPGLALGLELFDLQPIGASGHMRT